MNSLAVSATTLLLLHAGLASSEGLVVLVGSAGECELKVEAEVNETSKSLRLRAHHPTRHRCLITRDELVSALDRALSSMDPPGAGGAYSSVSIGRMVDFPWLSQYLATTAHADPEWDRKKGTPVAMDMNRYVSRLLRRSELLAQLEEPLARAGYRIVGVTVEKVLTGSFREVPSYQGKMHQGKVPYDAQVWFRLKKD